MVSSKVLHLTSDKFADSIKRGIVLVDFYAEWCNPCKMLAPVIEEVAEHFDGRLSVAKINIDDAQDLASEYRIMSVPTAILFVDGEENERIIGYNSVDEYIGILDRYF